MRKSYFYVPLAIGWIVALANFGSAESLCTPKMGNGGNVIAEGQFLAGKCEGAGEAPAVFDDEITFRVPQGRTGEKDRTELAFVNEKIPIGTPVRVTAEIKIPKFSDKTRSWFYILQFWQGFDDPSNVIGPRGPIAGIRINRGYSHRISFITRNSHNVKGSKVATVDLVPDVWTKVAIRLLIKSNRLGEATFTVNGEQHHWRGTVGYSTAAGANNWYRLKLGIYKDSEPRRSFEVQFRSIDIELG